MARSDGGPAYPEPERFKPEGEPLGEAHGYRHMGMSLRDRCAIAVVEGWGECFHHASYQPGATNPFSEETYARRVARFAYEVADAMLNERETTDE